MKLLALLPLALLSCDPTPAPKPPTVSVAGCRVDTDTAQVTTWMVPRGKRTTIDLGAVTLGEAGLSDTGRLTYTVPSTGSTVPVVLRIRDSVNGPILEEWTVDVWVTRPCR